MDWPPPVGSPPHMGSPPPMGCPRHMGPSQVIVSWDRRGPCDGVVVPCSRWACHGHVMEDRGIAGDHGAAAPHEVAAKLTLLDLRSAGVDPGRVPMSIRDESGGQRGFDVGSMQGRCWDDLAPSRGRPGIDMGSIAWPIGGRYGAEFANIHTLGRCSIGTKPRTKHERRTRSNLDLGAECMCGGRRPLRRSRTGAAPSGRLGSSMRPSLQRPCLAARSAGAPRRALRDASTRCARRQGGPI